MKLTEEIIVARSYYGIVGAPIERFSVNDKPYKKLLKNLSAEGIKIFEQSSEKKVN